MTDTDCAFGECSAPPLGCGPQIANCVATCP
jgi:hypothetical protein